MPNSTRACAPLHPDQTLSGKIFSWLNFWSFSWCLPENQPHDHEIESTQDYAQHWLENDWTFDEINKMDIRLVLVNNDQCAKPCERMQDLLRRLSLVQRAAATVQCTSVVFPFRVRNFGKINSRDLQFLCLPCPRSKPGISEASWLTSICSPMGATRGQKRRDSK